MEVSFDESVMSRKSNVIPGSLTSFIQNGDEASLQKFLSDKSVGVLNNENNGWYPLHEAVDLGKFDIVKRIVKVASKHGIDVLKKWDQNETTAPLYSKDKFSSYSFTSRQEDTRIRQTSFLRLSVLTKQLELVNFFIKLYKTENKPKLSLNTFFKQRRKSQSDVTHIDPHYSGIFHAILESVSNPEILRPLLEAFPEYVDGPSGKCVVFQYAVDQNQRDTIAMLLPWIFKLYEPKEIKPGFVRTLRSPLHRMWCYCLDWAYKNDDTTMLQMLFDATNQDLDTLDLSSTFLCDSMYIPLFHCCGYGTMKVLKFLQGLGYDVNKYCESCCRDLSNFRSRNVCTHRHFVFELLIETSYLFPGTRYRPKLPAIMWAALEKNLEILKYLLPLVDLKTLYKRDCPIKFAALNCSHEILEMLLQAGFYIDSYEFLDRYFEFLMNRSICSWEYESPDAGLETIRLLIKYGGVEVVFGQEYSTAALKEFLKNQFRPIVSMYGFSWPKSLDDEGLLDDKKERLFCLDKYGMFLKYITLFKVTLPDTRPQKPFEDQTVPLLQQLCRFTIRCRVVQKHRTLIPLNDLPLPSALISYLFCSDLYDDSDNFLVKFTEKHTDEEYLAMEYI